MKAPAELWWSDIAGPHSVVEQVIAGLQDQRHVVLDVPADLPWRHQLRSEVDQCLRERTGVSVQEVDWADQGRDARDIGTWLLHSYAAGPVADGYRKNSGRTIQQYIWQEGVLRERVLWIKGLDETTARRWQEFSRSYPGDLVTGGLFVLECHCPASLMLTRTQTMVRYEERVSRYDLQLFNSILLEQSERGCALNEPWRRYAAAVCAELCREDAELSHRLLEDTDFPRESPLDRLRALAQDEDFARRGRQAGSGHVLRLVRDEKTDALEQRVWTAQLQVAFPLIEMERVRYIQLLENQIADLLTKEAVEQYGQRITNPLDIELGTLCYYINQWRPEKKSYAICVPCAEIRHRLYSLRQRRNELAHVICCDPQQLGEIFDGMTMVNADFSTIVNADI